MVPRRVPCRRLVLPCFYDGGSTFVSPLFNTVAVRKTINRVA
jgi:hypothetical protein